MSRTSYTTIEFLAEKNFMLSSSTFFISRKYFYFRILTDLYFALYNSQDYSHFEGRNVKGCTTLKFL